MECLQPCSPVIPTSLFLSFTSLRYLLAPFAHKHIDLCTVTATTDFLPPSSEEWVHLCLLPSASLQLPSRYASFPRSLGAAAVSAALTALVRLFRRRFASRHGAAALPPPLLSQLFSTCLISHPPHRPCWHRQRHMENKAPGTAPRPEGYASAANAQGHENFFRPRQKLGTHNIQRAGLRSARRVGLWFTSSVLVFVVMPAYLGPAYVKYVAGSEWLERASKSIWQRRNEKDFELYMTQRKNTWAEWLGLKRYNISGEENDGDIQKYR
ncbi:hypothetical protein LdCL_250029400 [Leishmania donovani]|uniref:Transmembrane protein n=2 Tax=Leishmania donovani TaxID=5661 RepID=A0A3Q8ICI6_LEIDO|nr:hypothetical protein LdCL_250029400 [Leishmania donovani]